jgi:hypothetical protein
MVSAQRVGPGQALWKRGVDATTPAGCCLALQTKVTYSLPEDVPSDIWQLALRHFGERQLSDTRFHRVLEQRTARGKAADSTAVSVDAGARVAIYLLREWEQYQLARRLTPVSLGGRAGAPGQRSFGRSGRDRAAQVALLQKLGVSVPARRRTAMRPPQNTATVDV